MKIPLSLGIGDWIRVVDNNDKTLAIIEIISFLEEKVQLSVELIENDLYEVLKEVAGENNE
jgi:hypothetical protein